MSVMAPARKSPPKPVAKGRTNVSPTPKSSLRDRIRSELDKLIEEGIELHNREATAVEPQVKRGEQQQVGKSHVYMAYQAWYTKALPLVRQVLPDRVEEFQEYYRLEKRKEISWGTYTISDYMIGLVITRLGEPTFDIRSAFARKFLQQISILISAGERLQSVLSDITVILQTRILDRELDAAKELVKARHFRAAGVLAGVALERHLMEVLASHSVFVRKSEPSIGDLNDLLKEKSLIETSMWRFIQRLGDLRNVCAHSKDREPTKADADELIDGAQRVIKEIS